VGLVVPRASDRAAAAMPSSDKDEDEDSVPIAEILGRFTAYALVVAGVVALWRRGRRRSAGAGDSVP
ncbi:MAG: hypothetical protein M3394_01005, partial [Actinomycetota bacterium]|nr:hypothetical protein [Actinomycetota bacterium]MDQ3787867.1 hypothetical protein [Actinomycetota bacterium]